MDVARTRAYDTDVSIKDTVVSPTRAAPAATPEALGPWWLLVHQLPPEPSYLRVKVRRRLHKIGALPLKNSVYLLPANAETLEDFEWVRRLIIDEGGEASVLGARFVAGANDSDLRGMFQRSREAMYDGILAGVRTLEESGPTEAELVKLERQLSEVVAMDFFEAPNRSAAEHAVGRIHDSLHPATAPGTGKPEAAERFRGRTWVTRRGVKVDRLACTWFIRRFVDPDARIRFVDPDTYEHQPDEIRFDMFEGEFTHRGDLCSFEVFVSTFTPSNAKLTAIAEIVHDIDCKDARYERPETPGIASAIRGIATEGRDDDARIALGTGLFDALLAGLS